MILQSLMCCYETLAAQGRLETFGWSAVKVSWVFHLSAAGELCAVEPVTTEFRRDGRTVKMPRKMRLPTPVKRSAGILANLLCDNVSYVLGVHDKGNRERTYLCFVSFRGLHESRLAQVEHPAAQALLCFLRNWEPFMAEDHAVLAPWLSEICKAGNIIFAYGGQFLHDIPEIVAACEPMNGTSGHNRMVCLVTGKKAAVARLHLPIKGIPGAQPTGASLVSFNGAAYESFGRDDGQGYNAPVSEYAAFAYTEALNWLVRSEDHHRLLGETTMVFWAEGGIDAYARLFGCAIDGSTAEHVLAAVEALASGRPCKWEAATLTPANRFCVLGIIPNAARLSVRFFLSESFGTLMRNWKRHLDETRIVCPNGMIGLGLVQMLQETVPAGSRDRGPFPALASYLPQAVLLGQPYPVTLYQQVQMRIRAGEEITPGKAAILRAYLLRNVVAGDGLHPFLSALEPTVQASDCMPEVLGRLFALLEERSEGRCDLHRLFFNAACATPSAVFPTLLDQPQDDQNGTNAVQDCLVRQIAALLSRLAGPWPDYLSLDEQGLFQLGYYHQIQSRSIRKEEGDHG